MTERLKGRLTPTFGCTSRRPGSTIACGSADGPAAGGIAGRSTFCWSFLPGLAGQESPGNRVWNGAHHREARSLGSQRHGHRYQPGDAGGRPGPAAPAGGPPDAGVPRHVGVRVRSRPAGIRLHHHGERPGPVVGSGRAIREIAVRMGGPSRLDLQLSLPDQRSAAGGPGRQSARQEPQSRRHVAMVCAGGPSGEILSRGRGWKSSDFEAIITYPFRGCCSSRCRSFGRGTR